MMPLKICILFIQVFFICICQQKCSSKTFIVPDTSWSIDLNDGWTPNEILLLSELAQILPTEYKDPLCQYERIIFKLSDSPQLSTERSHNLGKFNHVSRRITLFTRGLSDRIRDISDDLSLEISAEGTLIAADYLFKRVIVHELTHIVDSRYHLSKLPEWRDLSGWRWWSRFVTPYTPFSSNSGDFSAPYGAHSPKEDLATFAEVYFLPPPLGPLEAEDAPKCRYPGKYHFMQTHLSAHPDPAPNVLCSDANDVGLGVDRVGEIFILLASPTLSRIASIGGHLLVAVELRDGDSTRWATYTALADNSDETDASSFTSIISGLVGGFTSTIVRRPYSPTRIRYVEVEKRDLMRYKLVLTYNEKTQLLERLDDLSLHWHRPYLFFQRNCTALVVELINSIEDKPLPSPFFVTPDMILAELNRRGRIEPVDIDPDLDLTNNTKARLLVDERRYAISKSRINIPKTIFSKKPEKRRDAYSFIVDKALIADDAVTWNDMAHIVNLSVPCEKTLDKTPDNSGIGNIACGNALEIINNHITQEEQQTIQTNIKMSVLRDFNESLPKGTASLSTAYFPLGFGTLVEGFNKSEPTKMLFIRHGPIDVVHGQPRLFAPAHGVDVQFLNTLFAVSPTQHPNLLSKFIVFKLGYYPESLLSNRCYLFRTGILSTHLSTQLKHAWVTWANADVGYTITRSTYDNKYLNVSFGIEMRSVFDKSTGSVDSDTWLTLPVSIQGAVFIDGSFQGGIEGKITGFPAFGMNGDTAFSLVSEAHISIFMGRIRNSAAKCEIGFQIPWKINGELSLPAAELRLGIRLERY